MWKAKSLSYGVRVTLIKAVLNALPTYFFSLYRAPVGVIKELDRIRRNFFWGGKENEKKVNWVAWDILERPVRYGGLGLGSLTECNMALLAKWWWRFKADDTSLWRKVVWAIHHTSRSWSSVLARMSLKSVWRNIRISTVDLNESGIDVGKLIKGVVGNGENIMFWKDRWVGTEKLCDLFPRLFELENRIYGTIREKHRQNNGEVAWSWQWKRKPTSPEELTELANLLTLVHDIVLNQAEDKWMWEGEKEDRFSVKDLKGRLVKEKFKDYPQQFRWCNWVPLKVSLVAWRATMERLPTRMSLQRRGIGVNLILCPLCDIESETAEHLFFSCGYSQMVWHSVGNWCKMNPIFAADLKDLLRIPEYARGNARYKKIVYGIFLVTFWCVWKRRNDRIFNNGNLIPANNIEEIKALSYLWINNRNRRSNIEWEHWMAFNLLLYV